MSREELRLELLKLVHTHGRTSAETIGRARDYEDFVVEALIESSKEEPSIAEKQTKVRLKKSAGNSDLFS